MGRFGVEEEIRSQDLERGVHLWDRGDGEDAGPAAMNHRHVAVRWAMPTTGLGRKGENDGEEGKRGESVGREKQKARIRKEKIMQGKKKKRRTRAPSLMAFPFDSSQVFTLSGAVSVPRCRTCRLQVAALCRMKLCCSGAGHGALLPWAPGFFGHCGCFLLLLCNL